MNPFRLLTKGSTIGGLKERPGAYKLLEKSVLPNFAGPKLKAPTLPHLEPAGTQSAFFRRLQRKAEKPAALDVGPAPASAPSPTPTQAPSPPAAPAAPAQELSTRPGMWSRLACMAGNWKRQWSAWRKPQPFQSPSIQTELALDKVRVIRNDLCEDDLEVVMIDKKTGNKTDEPAHSEEVEQEKLTAHP
jgi:hypothetical protein